MLKIGLTGGFGTGKTTVLKFFKRLGAEVVSSDELVHKELCSNNNLKKKLKGIFGSAVFEGKDLRRDLLAREVFPNPDKLKKLNALLHPLVKKRLFQLLRRSKQGLFVAEVPLLFETGFNRFFDVNIVVKASSRIAKKRLLKNTRFTQRDIALRQVQQLPLDKKIALCDFMIDNNKDKKKTFKEVKKIIGILKSQGGDKSGKA
jgi:dephospho-CoA kinase